MLETLFDNRILALFLVITTGLLLGRVRFLGLTLGSSGVIFSALIFGHLGYDIPDGVGTMGLVIFVYVVGLRAGPTFFRTSLMFSTRILTLFSKEPPYSSVLLFDLSERKEW